jgi:hypothetical protein
MQQDKVVLEFFEGLRAGRSKVDEGWQLMNCTARVRKVSVL